ncbi:MAG: hypothetical protein AB7O28_07710 [Vicinamibacterales bacterium]
MTPTPAAPGPAGPAGGAGGADAERTARRLHALRRDLARGARQQRRRWRYRVRRGRVEFDREMRELHARFRQGLPEYLMGAQPLSLLTAPVIYSLLVPLAFLDLWVWLYQWICFPAYGIARVPRAPYFSLDRHRLRYLNAIEKANCTFCTYANGLFAYVREVAARTEQYWCPIKHARPVPAPHGRYHRFFDYGDAAAYRHDLPWQRRSLAAEGAAPVSGSGGVVPVPRRAAGARDGEPPPSPGPGS